MKVVIIEDNPLKAQQITDALLEFDSSIEIEQRRSYQSGLRFLLNDRADLIVLDMTMPTYDITANEKGGRHRPYAGRDVLDEMKRKSIKSKVVVVTQFETFGEGLERKSLEVLRGELQNAFPDLYLGTVYYSSKLSGWRIELCNFVKKISEELRANE